MLEHVPHWLGHALGSVRAGDAKLAIAQPGMSGTGLLDLTSPAFASGARLPERFTEDGAGVSPPLVWGTPPAGTAHLALLVEDPDAPAPQPLVHAVVWGLAADAGRLAEGMMAEAAAGVTVGRASFARHGWLPPDPPTGHGEHRYVFQLFALDAGAGDPGERPGRSALVAAMTGHILAAGVLVGTYSRGEEATAPAAGVAAATG